MQGASRFTSGRRQFSADHIEHIEKAPQVATAHQTFAGFGAMAVARSVANINAGKSTQMKRLAALLPLSHGSIVSDQNTLSLPNHQTHVV